MAAFVGSGVVRRRRSVVRAVVQVDKGTREQPYKVAVLKGDGAGPKVASMTVDVLRALGTYTDLHFDFKEVAFGGEEGGNALPAESVEVCKASDAVLRAPQGSLRSSDAYTSAHNQLRDSFQLFAQLRPVTVYPPLLEASSFKNDHVEGVDLMLVREVSGGALGSKTGEEKMQEASGETRMVYSKEQVKRISEVALQIAEARNGNIMNVDKAYAIRVSAFWRQTLHDYLSSRTEGRSDIALTDMFVDDFCREVIFNPKKFDVVVTSNLFGDFLAEVLAGLSGPLRLSPSTWISSDGLHICGPADIFNSTAYPDGTGSPVVNPMAMIRSASMMLRYALDEPAAADLLQKALLKTLEEYVTPDVGAVNGQKVVDAATFIANFKESLDLMYQFEMVCDPEVCGE